MPYTINGIGTRYVGRTNFQVRNDVCEYCHQPVQLESYDTRTYFVVLFVPLIPLGRKRVIDICPACRRHRVLPLGNYHRVRDEALESTMREFRNDRQDPQKAMTAIATALHFHNEQGFQTIATELKRSPVGDADVLTLLGHGHEEFGRFEEAEEAFREALSLKDDPETHERLTINLVKQQRPDEAWEHVGHILENRNYDKVSLPVLVAESYQEWGMHEEALTVLDEVEAVFPQVKDVPEYRKLRRRAEKHRHGETPVKSKTITEMSEPSFQRQVRGGRLGRLVLPALLLIGLVVYLSIAVAAGMSREILIVNGLDRTYRVAVNDREYALSVNRPSRIKVPEGDVRIRVLDPALNVPERTLTIETGFWTRPLDDTVFVVNPDRAAVILWDEVIYVPDDKPQTGRRPRETLHTGRPLLTFKDVDYVFETPPSSISLDSGRTTVRHEVQQYRGGGIDDLAWAVADGISPEAAQEYLTLRFLYAPDRTDVAETLLQYTGPDAFIEQVRPHLDRIPPNVEMHRLYQHSMQLARPDHDLSGEYRRRMANHPDEAGLAYLLARIVEDTEEEQALYERAAAADPPCPQAFAGMAYNHLVCGRFEEAVVPAARAIELESGIARLHRIHEESLHATGSFEPLEEICRRRVAMDNDDLAAWSDHVYVLLCRGEVEAARQTAESCLAHCRYQKRDELANYLEAMFESLIAYVTGDLQTWKTSAQKRQPPLAYLLSTGQSDAAWDLLAGDEESADASTLLLVYIVARATSDTTTADAALDRMTGLQNAPEMRKAVSMLRGDEAPALDYLLRCPEFMQNKRLLLVAAGLRFGEWRPSLFALADRLNYDRRYPHDLIDRVVHEKPFLEPLPEEQSPENR